MSNSALAFVFYGYVWKSGRDPLRKYEDQDWEDVLLAKRGIEEPWTSFDYPEIDEGVPYLTKYAILEKARDEFRTRNKEALDTYDAAKADLQAEYGVERDFCGYADGELMYTLHIKDSCQGTCASEPIRFRPRKANPRWREMLDRWCGDLGVKPPQRKPRWWLAAYFG